MERTHETTLTHTHTHTHMHRITHYLIPCTCCICLTHQRVDQQGHWKSWGSNHQPLDTLYAFHTNFHLQSFLPETQLYITVALVEHAKKSLENLINDCRYLRPNECFPNLLACMINIPVWVLLRTRHIKNHLTVLLVFRKRRPWWQKNKHIGLLTLHFHAHWSNTEQSCDIFVSVGQ